MPDNGKILPGYSRYKFYLGEGGEISIVSRATLAKVTPLTTMSELSFSLTNDKGKRDSVSGVVIMQLFEDLKKKPQSGLKTPKKNKLTTQQVDEIKKLLGEGVQQKLIAQQFSIDQSTVSDIKRKILHKN